MSRRGIAAAMVAGVCLAVGGAVFADHHEGAAPQQPKYLIVHYDQVKPASVIEFESYGQKWVSAFTEKKMDASWAWLAYSNPSFGYAWVSPVPDYAFLDTGPEREMKMAEAMGEETMKELMGFMEHVDSHHTEILKIMPEFTYQPEKVIADNPTFAMVGTHTVKAGMEGKYEALVKKIIEAMKKAEAPLGFNGYKVEFGQGTYIFVTAANDAPQFFSQPQGMELLTKALGAEGAQAILTEWLGMLSAYDMKMWTFRPDMSYQPGAAPPAEE